jgi:hypothetical protein
MPKLEEIITDAEVDRVHGNANFGDLSKRRVIADGVLKYAFGYVGGHTQLCILIKHGLIHKPKPGSYKSTLTAKGRRYLRECYPFKIVALAPQMVERIAELEAAIRDVVREYPVAAGTAKYIQWDGEQEGYGSIRRARAALGED